MPPLLLTHLVQRARRRSSGNHRLQILPAASHAARVLLQEVAQRNAHLLLHHAGVVHVAADGEQLHARVVLATQTAEPLGAATQNRRRHRHRLAVRHRRRTPVQTRVGGEWRLQTRLALLALQRLQLRALFSAHVRSRAAVDEHVEVVSAAAGVATEESASSMVFKAYPFA